MLRTLSLVEREIRSVVSCTAAFCGATHSAVEHREEGVEAFRTTTAWPMRSRRRSKERPRRKPRTAADGSPHGVIDAQGAIAGIQLARAGRKASVHRPWSGRGAVPEALGGWRPLGPSAVAFGEGYAMPEELSADRIKALQRAFATAAARAYAVGFRAIEIHAAHSGLEFHPPPRTQCVASPILRNVRRRSMVPLNNHAKPTCPQLPDVDRPVSTPSGSSA